ncbi:MAG: hypothetical protein KGP27_08680 [Hyphomicrobiales bacterium]|nr:hypothetical protein [Hyphomicrobiales bacterium]
MTTTDRLRHDIDKGRTSDKVGAVDPAAAPLGTDDEAAGTPPSAAAIETARRHETKPVARHLDEAGATEHWLWPWVVVGLLVAAAATLAILSW